MKVVIGSDKSGFKLKEAIKGYFKEAGIEYIEVGTLDENQPVPFFKCAPIAAKKITSGEADKGVLICGTGMGMSQAANKTKGIRAACVEGLYSAKMSRAINDSNVICMGGWMISAELGIDMVKTFLNTEFTQGLEDWRQDFLKKAKKEIEAMEEAVFCQK